jgi:regulator of protease activity HflC (stomatin/prohibitin superfamily)
VDRSRRSILFAVVPERHLGLLLVDGVIAETLDPGLHAFWRHNRGLRVEQVDTRLHAMVVQGQEILTKDRVRLRVNLSATYRVGDPPSIPLGPFAGPDFLIAERRPNNETPMSPSRPP